MDIDAVITWVDGKDPVLAKKKEAYGVATSFQEDDVAGDTRFASVGEIYWCVASIRKYAPFIRKIFIVTDGQDPHIPDGSIPVEIVDHKDIFRGYEDALPVFNSLALETMTWRIPGLAEHYVEFNDDFMLAEPISEKDLFLDENTPVCYAHRNLLRHSIPIIRLTRLIKPLENGHKRVTFKGVMANAAKLAGAHFFIIRLSHAPRPLIRKFFEDYYAAHPEVQAHNISFRFRDASQFHPAELQYVSLFKRGSLCLKRMDDYLFCMEPKPRRRYVQKKMARLAKRPYKFCCFNSLDKAEPSDFALVKGWIDGKLS